MTMKRMSGVDAAFLYGETPSWHMHVSAVMIVDPSKIPGGFSVENLARRTAKRLHLAPQFRWRLVEVPFGLDRPGWIEDPDFNIHAHIRRIGVPSPGGPEQLGNLIGDLVRLKLDRRKPLWEFWVIEGLENGRIAILAKVHHSIVDGVSGSELASVLFDLEADPPEPEPAPGGGDLGERLLEPAPNPVALLLQGVGDTMLMPWRMARFAGQSVKQGLTYLGFQRQRGSPAAPFQAPRTPFNTELTPNRRFVYSSVPLDDVKGIKWAFDVKVNDVVLALCAGALRRYLLASGDLPDAPLIAQIPVSLRSDDERSDVGTKVGAMFASLATDVSDPALRLLSINDSTRGAKEMQRALAADKIMGLTETAPPGLVSLAARMYTAAHLDRRTPPIMNLIISNVPGPPFPLYCAGAEIEALYPMGPLIYGTGVNITVFSYRDRVDFGFMVCRDVVPDPWFIAEGIPLALEELKRSAEEMQG
jgi:diacylglycerol O-acyltransferase / wax synthase